MTKFDFLSVLVSIVFGIGLTHLCHGVFHLAYRRRLDEVGLLLAAFTFVVLVLNWWMFFGWRLRATWNFEDFLVLVLWALSFYGLAVALFPPAAEEGNNSDTRHHWFGIAFLANLGLDVVQTALLGTLFNPWYYLPFVGHYAICAWVIAHTRKHGLTRVLAWYLFLSVLLWSFVVRRDFGS
jgi:hypothetical protein